MTLSNRTLLWCGLFFSIGGSLRATITIQSIHASVPSPQPLGTQVSWTATATDTNPGPVAFEWSTALGSATPVLAKDYLPGTAQSGSWGSKAFPWATIAGEGTYTIQVTAKDFSSGESAVLTSTFAFNSLMQNGAFTVTATANPLIVIASVPPCPTRNTVTVLFQRVGSRTTASTNTLTCQGTVSSNFFVAGMLPSTSYTLNYRLTNANGSRPGPKAWQLVTGALPAGLVFPAVTSVVALQPGAETAQGVLLHSYQQLGTGTAPTFPVATNLLGQTLWYYDSSQALLVRPLTGGDMLLLQTGYSWDLGKPAAGNYLREVDLAGNIVHETNIGALQQELIGMGVTDMQPCVDVPLPAAVGSSCLTAFHHDAIRLPNGYTVVLCAMEKIFPPGTQGDTSGLNLDIIGNGLIVLDTNWQVAWYFDAFEHDTGLRNWILPGPPR